MRRLEESEEESPSQRSNTRITVAPGGADHRGAIRCLAQAAVLAQDASGLAGSRRECRPDPREPLQRRHQRQRIGKTIGYMSLGEYIPFVDLVSQGIADEIAKSGATYLFCDTNTDPATTLACAQQMKTGGAQGVINFQVNQAQSPEFCAAYDNVPTVAIDIIQPPCEKVFFGANNHEAGRLAGAGIGKYAKDNWNCQYDAYVSLESVGAGAANAARMGGVRDGFKESAPSSTRPSGPTMTAPTRRSRA